MISRLRGEVIERNANSVVVDVNGVGYHVIVTAQCRYRIGEMVDVHIHTNVREDALQLFGFADPIEREVFHCLLAVQNVGPAKAMGILETPVAELIELVAQKSPARLAKLPGVGKKTAERIILDLHEKLLALRPAIGIVDDSPSQLPRTRVAEDLLSALVNLGYKGAVAEEAAAAAIARLGGDAKLEDLLKDALAHGRS